MGFQPASPPNSLVVTYGRALWSRMGHDLLQVSWVINTTPSILAPSHCYSDQSHPSKEDEYYYKDNFNLL